LLPTINAIWIGPQLGQIHAACLRSFLRHGHRVVLHCYQAPADTPAGVELADARALLPECRVIRHRTSGSLALTSDLLRYEILKAGLGIYADCDVFCLRPIEDADYIFGREGTFKGKQLATAVLKLPPDSPTLTALCAIKDTPDFAPPWEKPAKPRRLAWLRGTAPAPSLEDLPWASIGPHALSYYAEQHGIADRAAPIDRFYPVPWMQLELLFDPGLSLQELVTHRSDTVHLYNSTLTRRARADIPEGSPIWEMVHAK
jgi:hypothetical protein